MVNNLKGADQDPETHPKIKSIAKNSLPLFLKAMNTSLAKELPDEPEEFYAAAVECVKGALNAVRGQGRYLMVAFPEEMKETKAGIDAIGREINVMTKALGRFKAETARVRPHVRHMLHCAMPVPIWSDRPGRKNGSGRVLQRSASVLT